MSTLASIAGCMSKTNTNLHDWEAFVKASLACIRKGFLAVRKQTLWYSRRLGDESDNITAFSIAWVQVYRDATTLGHSVDHPRMRAFHPTGSAESSLRVDHPSVTCVKLQV